MPGDGWIVGEGRMVGEQQVGEGKDEEDKQMGELTARGWADE